MRLTSRVEVHVLVHGSHAGGTLVIGEAVTAKGAAAEEVAEVLVQVRDEHVLVRGHVVGGLVLHERGSSSTVEEVDGAGHAVAVYKEEIRVRNSQSKRTSFPIQPTGAEKRTVEVLEKVDVVGSIVSTVGGEDTGGLDGSSGGGSVGIVTNQSRVNDKGEESLLGGSLGGVEEGHRVLVANRGVAALGRDSGDARERGSGDGSELHFGIGKRVKGLVVDGQ